MRTTLAGGTAFLIVAAILSGCSSNSLEPAPEPPPEFLLRTSPENVIANIVLAYEEMDADEYLDCLAADFIFYPDERDVQDPELNIPPEWYKTDEANMHYNMFDEESDVQSISLTMTNASTEWIEGIPGHDADDVYIYTENIDLRVNVSGGLTYLATSPSEFHIRVDQDQLGPEGETLWEIYLWYELGGGARGDEDPAREETSWGSVKALYR